MLIFFIIIISYGVCAHVCVRIGAYYACSLFWVRKGSTVQHVQVSSFTVVNHVKRTSCKGQNMQTHPLIYYTHASLMITHSEKGREKGREVGVGYKSKSSNTGRFAAALEGMFSFSDQIRSIYQVCLRSFFSLFHCLRLCLPPTSAHRAFGAAALLTSWDCEGRRRAAELSQWYSTPLNHWAVGPLAVLCYLQNTKEEASASSELAWWCLSTPWMHKYFFERDFHIFAFRVRVAAVTWRCHVAPLDMTVQGETQLLRHLVWSLWSIRLGGKEWSFRCQTAIKSVFAWEIILTSQRLLLSESLEYTIQFTYSIPKINRRLNLIKCLHKYQQ